MKDHYLKDLSYIALDSYSQGYSIYLNRMWSLFCRTITLGGIGASGTYRGRRTEDAVVIDIQLL